MADQSYGVNPSIRSIELFTHVRNAPNKVKATSCRSANLPFLQMLSRINGCRFIFSKYHSQAMNVAMSNIPMDSIIGIYGVLQPRATPWPSAKAKVKRVRPAVAKIAPSQSTLASGVRRRGIRLPGTVKTVKIARRAPRPEAM